MNDATKRKVERMEMTQVGTLKELGAQVGDVVLHRYSDIIYKIKRDPNGFLRNWNVVNGKWGVRVKDSLEYYEMISRATRSPVRTVTRKEIVPGVYGCVAVSDETADGVRVKLEVARMSASDLTAAIQTLTEIRDAMQENR